MKIGSVVFEILHNIYRYRSFGVKFVYNIYNCYGKLCVV